VLYRHLQPGEPSAVPANDTYTPRVLGILWKTTSQPSHHSYTHIQRAHIRRASRNTCKKQLALITNRPRPTACHCQGISNKANTLQTRFDAIVKLSMQATKSHGMMISQWNTVEICGKSQVH
jgi:hypothetical protein